MIKSLFTSAPRFEPETCAARICDGEAVLIDVREPGEWAGGVAQHAVLLPFSDLTGNRAQWTSFLADKADRELLVYCASGGRSAIAARILTSEGFRAANVGGFSDWCAINWPVSRPSRKKG